jgi:hypothetical protein
MPAREPTLKRELGGRGIHVFEPPADVGEAGVTGSPHGRVAGRAPLLVFEVERTRAGGLKSMWRVLSTADLNGQACFETRLDSAALTALSSDGRRLVALRSRVDACGAWRS